MGDSIDRTAGTCRPSRRAPLLRGRLISIIAWLGAGVGAVQAEPYFSTTPVTFVEAGERYLYEIEAIDPAADEDEKKKKDKGKKNRDDDDEDEHEDDRDPHRELTISVTELPGWLSFRSTGNTAKLEGRPGRSEVGQHVVEIRATGSDGTIAAQRFIVTVAADDSAPSFEDDPQTEVDDPPFIRSIGDLTASDGTPFRLELSEFVDDEESPNDLRYDVSGLPPGLAFDPRSGLIDGTPRAEGKPNFYRIRFTVSDGRNTSAAEFTLTVLRRGSIDLALSISIDSNPSTVNARTNWVFTVTNNAALFAADAGARIEASFHADTPIAFDPLPGGCTLSRAGNETSIACTTEPIPASGSSSIRLSSTAGRAGEVFVYARVSPAGRTPADDTPDNDTASTTLGIAQRISATGAQKIADVDVLAAAAGDLDGDGRTDLVVGTAAGQAPRLYLNTIDPQSPAKRTLSGSAIDLGGGRRADHDIALADLDRDGDLDIVTATGGSSAGTIFENAGNANFAAVSVGSASAARAVAAGDIDGDGFADVVFAGDGATVVLRNSGAGMRFAPAAQLSAGTGTDVLLIDLAGSDGLPELVIANRDGNARVYANNNGAFGPATELPTGPTTSVASADLNGDGLSDLVFGRATSLIMPTNLVFLNASGSALRFSGTPAGLGASPTSAVVALDADADRDMDLLFINTNGIHQIFVNSAGASAIFALYPEQLATARARTAVAGSFGVDDRIDIAVAGPGGVSIFYNDGNGNFGLGDREPPVLHLLGPPEIDIDVGGAYADPGATAVDVTDGDVSERVTTENAVDTNVIGTYTIRYEATDLSGNAATPVTRTVRVGPREAGGGGGGGAFGLVALAMLVLARRMGRYGDPSGCTYNAIRLRNNGKPECRKQSIMRRSSETFLPF